MVRAMPSKKKGSEPEATPQAPAAPWTAKATVAVLALGLLGGTCGGVLGLLAPDGGLFAPDRAETALRADTAASLKTAVGLADDDDAGVAALAHALLWREHAAPDEHRSRAEKLLVGAARSSATGLYARALLVEGGAQDDSLDTDLKAAPDGAWSLLARASRSADGDERLTLLERAATTSQPLPHATHRWARAAAAAGDLPLARAALDRLFRLAPDHPGGLITAVVVGAAEEQALPENRRRKASEPGPDEQRLRDRRGGDDDDALVAMFTLALDLGRGVEVPAERRAAILEACTRSGALAKATLEVALVAGDAELAAAVMKAQKSIERLDLLVMVSRARFLQALPAAEVRAAAKGPRGVDGAGVTLPFGVLRFVVEQPGLPWSPTLSSSVYPERRYFQLLAALERGGRRERLDQRLQAIEQLGLADRALAAGDITAATTFVRAAGTLAGADPDVALTEATVLARGGDARAANVAIDSAVAATEDPELLLTAARIALEVDHLGGARRALSAFKKLGLRAARAAALEAMLEARSGDLSAARAALGEAGRLGGGDDVTTLRAAILAHRLVAPDEARAAASRLLALGSSGGGDVVTAWLADAARRKGDASAETTLLELTRSRPQIAEAHLFFAEAIAYNPTRQREALAAATLASKRLSGPLAAEAKAFLAKAKAPAKKKRR
jgi:hypothetical protein